MLPLIAWIVIAVAGVLALSLVAHDLYNQVRARGLEDDPLGF